MPFIPENRLEESLMKAGSDPAHRPQFYKHLLASDLFVVKEGISQGAGQRVTEKDEEVRLRQMSLKGKAYLPMFTSLTRLQAVLKEEATFLSMKGADLLRMTKGFDVLLNAGSDYGKELSEEEIAALLEGRLFRPPEAVTIPKGSRVMIGQPARFPTDLVDTLTRFFLKSREVRRAYVAHFFNPDVSTKGHTLVAIEMDGDWHALNLKIGAILNATKIPDPPVDFIRVTGGQGIQEYFREAKPFYERK